MPPRISAGAFREHRNLYKVALAPLFMTIKRDVHHHIERYKNWKADVSESGIDGISKINSDILIEYIFDMEQGINIPRGSKKGGRSFQRLNNLNSRITFIMRILERRGIKDIKKTKEEDLMHLFNDMRKGVLKTKNGETYKSVADYVKVFKAFWHWHMTKNRKAGIQILDICEDLDTSREKAKFVYLTKDQLERMLPYFGEDEQVVLMFIFDTLIRSPTELLSMRVKDIYQKDGDVYFYIPAEISKTIGRQGNFLFCGQAVLKYIERNKLGQEDYLFSFPYVAFNDKMQTVARQLFGDKLSHPRGEMYSKITLYDLRHSGACHLRQLAQKSGKISLDAIRQRGGWVDLTMLNYYTEFLGLTGEINKEDLMVEEDKSKIEKEIYELKKEHRKTLNMLNKLNSFMKNQVKEGFSKR